jgi:hypothetical protein
VGLQAACVVVAIALTLAGVWVGWRLPWLQMDAEELRKDGNLTSRQVDRRVRWARDGGRLLTLTGLGLLGASLLWASR